MDDELYRLHAACEETYWWWIAKNRLIAHIIQTHDHARSGYPGSPSRASTSHDLPLSTHLPDSRSPSSQSPQSPLQPSPRPKALDIGCGAGAMLQWLSSRYDALGVDMSPIARALCAARGLHAADGALPDQLPIQAPDSIDVVVMSEVLEHVPDDAGSVRAVLRIVKPGGLIVCTVPAHQWMWSSHDDFNQHVRRYTRRSFAALWVGLPVQPLLLTYANALMFLPMAAVRLAARVLGDRPAQPTVKPLPALLNRALAAGFAAERRLWPITNVPIGSSVFAAYRKRPAPAGNLRTANGKDPAQRRV